MNKNRDTRERDQEMLNRNAKIQGSTLNSRSTLLSSSQHTQNQNQNPQHQLQHHPHQHHQQFVQSGQTVQSTQPIRQSAIVLSHSSQNNKVNQKPTTEFILFLSDTKSQENKLMINLVETYDSIRSTITILDLVSIYNEKNLYPWFTASVQASVSDLVPALLETKTNVIAGSGFLSSIDFLEEHFLVLQETQDNIVNHRNKKLLSEYSNFNQNQNQNGQMSIPTQTQTQAIPGSVFNNFANTILNDTSQFIQRQEKIKIKYEATMTRLYYKQIGVENKLNYMVDILQQLQKNNVGGQHQSQLLPASSGSSSSNNTNSNFRPIDFNLSANKTISASANANGSVSSFNSTLGAPSASKIKHPDSKKIATMYDIQDYKQANPKDIEDRIKETEEIERLNNEIIQSQHNANAHARLAKLVPTQNSNQNLNQNLNNNNGNNRGFNYPGINSRNNQNNQSSNISSLFSSSRNNRNINNNSNSNNSDQDNDNENDNGNDSDNNNNDNNNDKSTNKEKKSVNEDPHHNNTNNGDDVSSSRKRFMRQQLL